MINAKYYSLFTIGVAAIITILSFIQVVVPSIIPGNPEATIDSKRISLLAFFINPAGAVFNQLEIMPTWNPFGITSLILIVLSVCAGAIVWQRYRYLRPS